MAQAASIGSESIIEGRGRDPMLILGFLLTVALHGGIFFGLWEHEKSQANRKDVPVIGTFVEASLVKFGTPRDLKFLPHKEGVVKNNEPPPEIKIAKEADALPVPPDERPPPNKFDPLKKTHAEKFKNLIDDDRPAAVAEQGGQLSGSRAGTADEASGDPYILMLKDRIGSAWTIPTTIKDSDLMNLSATVCLTINDAGQLVRYQIQRGSGNSQFDSSLEATLGSIRSLPPPAGRYAEQARRGLLCADLAKQ